MIAMKTLLLMVMGLAVRENGGYCVDCIIRLFWIRYRFLFIGCYKAAQETGAKFVPQNTAFQCWNNVVIIRNNVATMLQSGVALKS